MDSNESSAQLFNCVKNNEKEVYKRELQGIENKTDKNSSRSDQIPSTSGVTNGPQFRHLSSNSYDENGSNSFSVPLLKTSENNTILSDKNMPCDENVLTSKVGNESGTSDEEEVELVNIEKLSCQRYKPCHEKASTNDYDFNVPSTSSTTMACKIENVKGNLSNFKDSIKRPSNLRLNRSNVEADASSSDTGNDDYSLGSEDGCIYTYRGGEHLADLPSSFFSLDMGLPLDKHLPVPPHYRMRQEGVVINNPGQASRASSPDMDFLEMDFDPGPSCEADTGDKSSPEEGSDVSGQMPDEIPPPIREDTPSAEPNLSTEQMPLESVSYNEAMQNDEDINVASSISKEEQCDENIVLEDSSNIYGPYITHINFRGEKLLVRRSTSSCAPTPILNLHSSGGDVVSMYKKEESEAMWELHQRDQRDRFTLNNSNLASVLYHQTMAKKLMVEKEKGDFVDGGDSSNLSCEAEMSSEGEDSRAVEVSRNMVWSEQEACERQVVQMGASTCGVVAVINAFLALGIPVDTEKIKSAIAIRQRHNDAPLVRYLLSRTVAGCTAAELVSGIQRASDGLVTARFFSMYPERAMSLSHWLADWISIELSETVQLNSTIQVIERILYLCRLAIGNNNVQEIFNFNISSALESRAAPGIGSKA
ncbi:hypothetical protein EVAR_21558_1 [Eumeta japonica]|uniref:Uncharacterized protein n=1 Tax=Eumeta variegata TaxID=151549 RepID=A0A4C1XM94_EUMVA|nr:hypothetical protein EVAR_21558_1 [Eumeta japonica]